MGWKGMWASGFGLQASDCWESFAACEPGRLIDLRGAAPGIALHALPVPLDVVDVREAVRDGADQRADDLVGRRREAVVNPEPFLPRVDETRSTQVGQVARGPGLRDLQRLVDVAHADLAPEQQAENPKAGPVCEGLEQGFQRVERGVHIFALTNISRLGRLVSYSPGRMHRRTPGRALGRRI